MRTISLVFWIGITGLAKAQNADSLMFKKIFDEALLRGESYKRLGELCKTVGARLSGSENAAKGVIWAKNMLHSYHFDSVFLQPVMVPCWKRGAKDALWIQSRVFTKEVKKGLDANNYNCEAFEEQNLKPASKYKLQACALGGSVGTKKPITGEVVVINSQKELQTQGLAGNLKDKIVLLNQAFDQSQLQTFASYGACVGQRVRGASQVAKYGATAVMVRSMSNSCDLHAHTGVMIYDDSFPKIPAMAVATAVANFIESLLKRDPLLKITLQMGCETKEDQPSHNIVAETKGKIHPKKIIVFGGHFDSWDQGEGAHDDGAGCMHAFEALRILKAIGYEPKHTLRCVFWINEENGLRGALEYARLAKMNGEEHVAALESDRGGFVPRGFGVDTNIISQVLKFKNLLEIYNIGKIEKGGGGADIGPLLKNNPGISMLSLTPDAQRYFDVHHADTDVFENVNKRELEMGAAAVAVMIWILDNAKD